VTGYIRRWVTCPIYLPQRIERWDQLGEGFVDPLCIVYLFTVRWYYINDSECGSSVWSNISQGSVDIRWHWWGIEGWVGLVCLSGDNILTAVSVARQCALIPAGDQLVFVNAYSPSDETSTARIEWLCQDDFTRTMDPAASSSLTTNQVIVAVFCTVKDTWHRHLVTIPYISHAITMLRRPLVALSGRLYTHNGPGGV